MRALTAAIAAAIRRENLLRPDARVLVGYSGGPDSTALLLALKSLGYAVSAAHFDHGWRSAGPAEAAWAAARCAEWGLPCHLGAAEAGLRRSEAAAREARFLFFRRVASQHGYEALALGHHADDQLETMLFRLARGAGPSGLAGMRFARDEGALRVVRPMLAIPRAQVRAALIEAGVPTLDDPSNQDPAFARNRLRRDALGALYAVNAAAATHAAATAALLADEDALLQESTVRLAKFIVRAIAPGLGELDLPALRALPKAQQLRLLRHAAQTLGARGWGLDELEAARGVAHGEGAVNMSGNWQVFRVGERLVLDGGFAAPAPVPVAASGAQATGSWGWGIRVEAPSKMPGSPVCVRFDASALPDDLVWRSAAPERDRFQPWGHARTRSLRRYLANAGVPAHRQAASLVLARGDEVWWVVGVGRSAKAPMRTPEEAREMQAFACFEV